jgi:hypothetical protein
VSLQQSRSAPAEISFRVADAESHPVSLALSYSVGGGDLLPASMVSGVSDSGEPVTAELQSLASSADGVVHTKLWDFLSDLGGDHFRQDVTLHLEFQDSVIQVSLSSGLGNDPPTVSNVQFPSGELRERVLASFVVSDSSSDVVSIRVEYDVVGDAEGFLPARSASLGPQEPTPDPTIVGVQTTPQGILDNFIWSVEFDLVDREEQVHLRFTPDDGVVAGEPWVSPLVKVDTNAEPVVEIDGELFASNPDSRGGIPIPLTISDDEGDRVEVVVQWRKEGEEYPALPTDVDELRAVLDDAELRSHLQIATERPRVLQGMAVGLGAVQDTGAVKVRLEPPPTRYRSGHLPAFHPVNREVEILRRYSVPRPTQSSWSANPLVEPVGAAPLSEGLKAVVVDRPTPGSWRLQEVQLATGVVQRVIATGTSGDPTAFALEQPDQQALLLAALDGDEVNGVWHLHRIALADGTEEFHIQSDLPGLAGVEQGRIRDVDCLGTRVVLATVGSSLLKVFAGVGVPPAPRAVAIATLDQPWGIAVRRSLPNSAYVAESGQDRILHVDLVTYALRELPAGGIGLAAPQDLAMESQGAWLLAVTDDPASTGLELRSVPLQSSVSVDADSVADAPVHQIAGGIAEAASLQTGPNLLRILGSPAGNDLSVAGGLLQRRTVAHYDVSSGIATVHDAFDPRITDRRHLLTWRVHDCLNPIDATPEAGRCFFVWDSTEVWDGTIFLRACAFDDELGLADTTRTPRFLTNQFDAEPETFSVGTSIRAILGGDLEGDGDVDLLACSLTNHLIPVRHEDGEVFSNTALSTGAFPEAVIQGDFNSDGLQDVACTCKNSGELNVYHQGADFTFPDFLSLSTDVATPKGLAACDLDSDGRVDLISANFSSDNLTIFYQDAAGMLVDPPQSLFIAGMRPFEVDAGDLDGDGDLDLVSANKQRIAVAIFWQEGFRQFSATPTELSSAGLGIPRDVRIADLSSDGLADILVRADGGTGIHLQQPDGSFLYHPQSPFSSGSRLEIADFNADGRLDFLAGTAFHLQQSDGSFEPIERLGASVGPLTARDFDGDGKIDVATTTTSSVIGIFVQSEMALKSDSTLGPTSGRALLADLDANGLVDLVRGFGEISIYLQETPGVFLGPPIQLAEQLLGSLRDLAVVDIERDGDLDVVILDFDEVIIFKQKEPGEFLPVPQLILDLAIGAVDLLARDLDKDGRVDIAIASTSEDRVQVFFQDSSGAFAEVASLTGLVDATSTVAEDLDGDNLMDLVVSHRNALSVFRQSPPGQFTATTQVMTSTAFPGARLIDVTGDGVVDLLTGGSGVRLFEATSPGVFSATPQVLGSGGITLLQSLDFDQNGLLDFVDLFETSIILQEAPGVFVVRDLPASHMMSSDIDGDGVMDFVANDGLYYGGR